MKGNWAVFGVLLALAVIVGLMIGNTPASRLKWEREGKLLGTSQVGEWADLGAYGMKVRVDDVAIADALPAERGGTARAADGLQLVRVRVTLEPTIDITASNSFEMFSCLTKLITADGKQISQSVVLLEGPSQMDCASFSGTARVGEQLHYQAVYQIKPSDAEGLKVRVHWLNSPLPDEPPPTWDFVV